MNFLTTIWNKFFRTNSEKEIPKKISTEQLIGESLQTIFNVNFSFTITSNYYRNPLFIDEIRTGKFLFTHTYKNIKIYIYDEVEPELKYFIGELSRLEVKYKHGIWDEELFECLKHTAIDKETERKLAQEEHDRIWREKCAEEARLKEIQDKIDLDRILKMFEKNT